MDKPLSAYYSMAVRAATAALVLCLLFLAGCGGGSANSFTQSPPPPPPPPPVAPGTLPASAFGFQCSINQNACGPSFAWPSSSAQPGTLRLWDSKTDWNDIETTKGSYDFTILDGWLDMIAAQNSSPSNAWNTPINVIFTFGFVACVEASSTAYETPKGCIYPPSDFTSSGSASFNAFVTKVVKRCNANGHCVKDLIKNYEMWNEPNVALFWHDTSPAGELEIYQMVAPAVAIIRANVPNAVIMSMASTVDANYTAQWLTYENTYGILSDVVVWHQYLNHFDSGTQSVTEVAPEDSLNMNAFDGMLNKKDAVSGWASKPWRITETGFQAYNTPYNCDPTLFSTSVSTDDCIGQMVRWQLIALSNGGQGMDWYNWDVNIGPQPNYSAAWSFMMQHAVGGKFTGACAVGSDGVTWTCPFTEASGKTAEWVWTTDSSGGTYTVPSGYTDYVSLSLASTPPTPATNSISSGQSVNITTMPLLLEQ